MSDFLYNLAIACLAAMGVVCALCLTFIFIAMVITVTNPDMTDPKSEMMNECIADGLKSYQCYEMLNK